MTNILVIAAVDSSGGAGLVADACAARMWGARVFSAVTALTLQGDGGVEAVLPTPAAFLRRQIAHGFSRGVGAIKSGVLATRELVATVAGVLAESPGHPPLVVDPVLCASGGGALTWGDAMEAVRGLLVPMATLVTPNMAEASVLVGFEVRDEGGMVEAARVMVRGHGAAAVLVTGGDMAGDEVVDVFATRGGISRVFREAKIKTSPHVLRGTGCRLATSVAVLLARGEGVAGAVVRGRSWLRRQLAIAAEGGELPAGGGVSRRNRGGRGD